MVAVIGAIEMDNIDTYTNLVAALGVGKDKRKQGRLSAVNLTDTQLEDMYTYNWLCGKVIDIPVDDMTRKWRSVSAPSIDERIEQVRQFETQIGLRDAFNEAQKWADLYGGAVILLGIEGTDNFEMPLDLNFVRQDSLKFLRVLDRTEISPQDTLIADISHERYRQPIFYSTGTERIHWTRVLQFEGIKLPWKMRQQKNNWGRYKHERF